MSIGSIESLDSRRDRHSVAKQRPAVLALIQEGINSTAAGYALGILMQTAGAAPVSGTYRPGDAVDTSGFDAVISYGQAAPRDVVIPHLHIASSDFFSADCYLRRRSLPKERIDREGLSCLFKAGESLQPGMRNSGRRAVALDLDLVASAFVLLTCYEETVTSGTLDRRGRRQADESLQLRLSLIDRPVVNEYARYVASLLNEICRTAVFGITPWSADGFCLAVTRDIDSNRKHSSASLRSLASLAARGRIRMSVHNLRQTVQRKLRHESDPFDNIGDIVAWEESLGIRSSLYLMASELLGDANYCLADLAVKWKVKELQERGWEIGFHPGFRTYCSDSAFQEERKRFEESVPVTAEGGRQHGLRFLPPHTWRSWEDSGFRYDTSIGFAEREGFKCGICVPFRPFDVLENRVMNVWEIPLTLMDSTLDVYRKQNASQSRRVISGLVDQVKTHGGVFTLLWHNNYFGESNSDWVHRELAGFVERSVSEGARVSTAIDVINAWETWIDA